MASSPEETADSRTSGVGRKRTLRETSPYENNDTDSSDEESAQQFHKRVKPNQEDLQDEPSFVEQIPNNIAPAIADPAPSSLPEISNLSTPTEQVGPPSTSWNQGVQGGLRTSFTRKKIARRPSIPLVMEEIEVEEQPTSLVGKETQVMPQSGDQDPSGKPSDMPEADPNLSSDEMDRMIANDIVESEGPRTRGDVKRAKSNNRVLDENDRPLSKKQTQRYHAILKQFEAEDKRNGHKRSLEQLRAQTLALVRTSNTPGAATPINSDAASQTPINLPEITQGYYTSKSRSTEYVKGGITWHICEIANTGDKKPIQLEQFNYRIFAASFLSDNVDQFCSLSRELRQQPKLFVKALSLYAERFFTKDPVQKRNKLRNEVKSERGQKWLRALLNILPEQKEALQNMFTTSTVPAPSVTIGSSSKPAPSTGQTFNRDFGPSDAEQLQIITTSAAEAEAAKNEMKDAENLDEPAKADNAEHETNNGTSYSVTGTNSTSPMETASEAMDTDEEVLDDTGIELQVKYFPTPKGEPVLQRCIACAASGHTSAHCPAMRCYKCGIVGLHSTLLCPQNQRCSKCRQRGHQLAECPEKLYVSKAEADPCDLCESKDHLEVACPLIWRSFDLKPEEIRRVRDIPIHCYCCGGSGHFGPECGLSNHRALSGNRTWSSANWKQYIDYNSKERAISAGVDYSLPPKKGKGFSIKGKANNPIELDDSDDDEISFIRPKVNVGSQDRGNIRFGAYGNDNYAPVDNAPSSGRGRYQPDPPRTSRAAPMNNYDSYQPRDDSARYGREKTFSPPPRYNGAARFDSQQQRNPPHGGFSRHDQASAMASNGFGDGGRAVRGGGRGRGRGGNTAAQTGNRPNPVEDKPKRVRQARKPRATKADRYKSK